MMKCAVCDHVEDDLKRFSNHVNSAHKISSENYTIDFLCGGVKPTCAECGDEVRYVSFSYKTYCKKHAKLAMKEAGARGGRAPAWNRGRTKHDDERLLSYSQRVSGQGNHFYGHRHTSDVIEKISLSKLLRNTDIIERISERASEFKLLTPINEYVSRQQQHLSFECLVCGEVQSKTLQAFERGSRCYRCNPIGKSNWELEVFDFVKSIAPDAESGNKRAIAPKELDIYVPSKKFGIECHGLYWHSEGARQDGFFDKKKHLSKFNLANSVGIKLLQLFEDEWRDKREICQSLILNRLGMNSKKCKTWSTQVVELDTKQERAFFDRTHISGYAPSKICWGLKDRNGETVAALSLRVPRHGKKYEGFLEVARFSTELNTSVPGGLSKLMCQAKKFYKENSFRGLMTYVDRRIGDGGGYIKTGFSHVSETGVDYWYTDNQVRYDRFKFRASGGRSEAQVAQEMKVSRIYGCGSLVMLLDADT
jgi:hypothetical protein